MGLAYILIGALLGLVCGGIFALALHRESMRAGFAAIIITFALVSGGIIAVHLLAHDQVPRFGMAAMLVFLAIVVALALGRQS